MKTNAIDLVITNMFVLFFIHTSLFNICFIDNEITFY